MAVFLREQVYRGELKPGTRLLEVELCNQLEVSRAPIREALLTLQSDGLVTMRPHRGATVATFSDDDIREIYQLRQLLDPVAARAAAVRRDPATIASLREQLDVIAQALARDDGLQVAIAHADFHRALGRGSGMVRVSVMIDGLCTQMLASHTGSISTPRRSPCWWTITSRSWTRSRRATATPPPRPPPPTSGRWIR